jgi:hypothetical protein
MNMILGIVSMTMTLTQTWESSTPAGTIIVGPATRYDEDLMPRVLYNQNIITDTALYDAWLSDNGFLGVVALERKGDKFREVWINGKGPYFVGDCRALHDYPGKFAVEFDYKTAMRMLEEGPWPETVTITFMPPRSTRFPRMAR